MGKYYTKKICVKCGKEKCNCGDKKETKIYDINGIALNNK